MAYEPNNEVNGITYARELASEERSVEAPRKTTHKKQSWVDD